MTNRTQAPNILDAVDLDLQLKHAEQFTLDNGVPVYSVDGGSQDVLFIEFVFMQAIGTRIKTLLLVQPTSC
jgi:hypothetical protein